jgi:hypothetical protein
MRTSSKYSEIKYMKQYNITSPDEIKNIGVETSEYNKKSSIRLDINELLQIKQETEIKTLAKRITDEQRRQKREKMN